jgi:hypothetical protein
MFTMAEDPKIELPVDQLKKIKIRDELDDYFTGFTSKLRKRC